MNLVSVMSSADEQRLAIGAAFRAARELRGLSQPQLAQKIGKRPATISDIERGVNTPDTETLLAAADALGCSVDALLGRADLPNRESLEDVASRLREIEAETATMLQNYEAALKDAEAMKRALEGSQMMFVHLLGVVESLPGLPASDKDHVRNLRERLGGDAGA